MDIGSDMNGEQSKRRTNRQIIGALIALAILLVATTITPWLIRRIATPQPADAAAVAKHLELARTALAATESLDTRTAETHWTALFQQLPNDQSVALNRAINRSLHVDALMDATTSPALDGAAKQAAQSELPSAIAEAREAIDDLRRLEGASVIHVWLASRIDLQHALMLAADPAQALRQSTFIRLSNAIKTDFKDATRVVILGGLLIRAIDESESSVSGLPLEIIDSAADTMARLSVAHPDNLYIALRTARLGITAQRAGVVEAIERTRQLSQAIHPMLEVSTRAIGLTPDELVQGIIDAVNVQDWQKANGQMNLWFNVLNSSDLVKTDRRLALPHPLDRLSFDILRRLSYEVARDAPISPGKAPLAFEAQAIGPESGVIAALAIDIDLDLIPEMVALTADRKLSIWKSTDESAWKQIGQLELPIECTEVIAADLFMVDASDPNRLQVTPKRSDDTPLPPARHTTLPTLIAFGTGGAILISVDGRDTTSDEDRLTLLGGETGLETLTQVTAAVVGDLEGDGDLDLVFATRDRGLRMFINRGNRTFFELDQTAEMKNLVEVSALAVVDIDRDLDLDIVIVNPITGRIGIVENLLHLQFRYRTINEIPGVFGANYVRIADIDGNVSWDIIVGSPGRAHVIFSHTPEAGVWGVDRIEAWKCEEGRFVIADFDNDSWYELLITRNSVSMAYRLLGSAAELETKTSGILGGRFVSATDVDLDGRLDVLSIIQGRCTVFRNVTDPVGHHIAVRFRGIDDNNANSGRVNHYAIGSVVELRFGPHYRAQIITTPTTHFGLGGFDAAASLRVIFPNGLTQTVREPLVDTLVEEEQTLKGSCPYLYAWDGEKFAFVTDCLWAAPLGLQVADGVVAKDRPWEYLKVNGDFLKPRGGQYELRITEELWEIAYFDHVSLVAVDHPADVDIWTNEKVGPAEIATPRIYAFSPQDRRPLSRGQDTLGRDVTESLHDIDGQYVQGFDRRIRQGLCPPHWVDLAFEPLTEPRDDASVFLVMTGWILPTDTSLNIQIDQNPEIGPIEFPSVWVPDATVPEGWRKAIPFMGFPGGKTKTIVVDVTDVIQDADPQLRIRTSAQIYWDAAELVVQRSQPEIVTHALRLQGAVLNARGFSDKYRSSPLAPEVYHYDRVSPSPKWPPLRGRLTHFGDCLSLVDAWDDTMVVMGSGDEMRLTFSVPDQALPPGWKRDFVLHCVGWDKDADLNTLTGQSSEPLPFRAMTEYPPVAASQSTRDRVERLNQSHLRRTQSFRQFWSRP